MSKHWDIFCRVVDNLGDAGVCWRLARQLAGEHGIAVRLWIDDLKPMAALHPGLDPALNEQTICGVSVRSWPAVTQEANPGEVVIEAFACDPPAWFMTKMSEARPQPVWINLEYLSAESWIEDCHGLASIHPASGLTKYFYFPGFTARTGGLLRESYLPREAALPRSTLKVSLFCYETAPVARWLSALRSRNDSVEVRVPPGKPRMALGGFSSWLDANLQDNPLKLLPVPFLSQGEFDQQLRDCNLNFVRGEDSFLRAQWAGRPFVWQIYPTDDGVHLVKLAAFLDHYLEGLPHGVSSSTRQFFMAWNGVGDVASAWLEFLPVLPNLAAHAMAWRDRQFARPDLAKQLVSFCAEKV